MLLRLSSGRSEVAWLLSATDVEADFRGGGDCLGLLCAGGKRLAKEPSWSPARRGVDWEKHRAGAGGSLDATAGNGHVAKGCAQKRRARGLLMVQAESGCQTVRLRGMATTRRG